MLIDLWLQLVKPSCKCDGLWLQTVGVCTVFVGTWHTAFLPTWESVNLFPISPPLEESLSLPFPLGSEAASLLYSTLIFRGPLNPLQTAPSLCSSYHQCYDSPRLPHKSYTSLSKYCGSYSIRKFSSLPQVSCSQPFSAWSRRKVPCWQPIMVWLIKSTSDILTL